MRCLETEGLRQQHSRRLQLLSDHNAIFSHKRYLSRKIIFVCLFSRVVSFYFLLLCGCLLDCGEPEHSHLPPSKARTRPEGRTIPVANGPLTSRAESDHIHHSRTRIILLAMLSTSKLFISSPPHYMHHLSTSSMPVVTKVPFPPCNLALLNTQIKDRYHSNLKGLSWLADSYTY